MINIKHKITTLFDDWVHYLFPMTIEQQGLFRILFASYVIFILGIPDFSFLGGLPSFIFTPPKLSFASFFNSFPSKYILYPLSFLLYIFFVFLLFGYKTKFTSITISLILLIGFNFYFSFGKIDHNILFVILPLVMAFSNWGEKYSIDELKSKNKHVSLSTWPVTLMALFLGFAMFTAGLPKLLSGWLDLSSNAVRGHFYYNYYGAGRMDLLASFFINVTNSFFWECLDYTAIIFELLFFVAIIKANWFRLFVFMAIVFHLINLFIFNISFSVHIPIYLLFINWSHFEKTFISKRIKELMSTFFTKKNMVVFLFFSSTFWAYSIIWQPLPLWSAPSPVKVILNNLGVRTIILKLLVLICAFILGITQIHFFFKKMKQ